MCVDDSVDTHTHAHTTREIARATFKVNARLIHTLHTERNALALIDLNTRTHTPKERKGGRGRWVGRWWAYQHTASHRNELNFSTIYITAHTYYS